MGRRRKGHPARPLDKGRMPLTTSFWSPSSSTLSPLPPDNDSFDHHFQPRGAREEQKRQAIPLDRWQVRLRVQETGAVKVTLRYFPSSPEQAGRFSLTALQSEIEKVFPPPLTPEQRQVVEVWQQRAVEQAETIRGLLYDLDKARFHQENAEERCSELERQLQRFEERQLSFEGLHASIVPTTNPRKEIVQLKQEVKVCLCEECRLNRSA